MKTTAKTPQILKFTTGHWTSGARSSRFGYVNGCNRLKDPVHSRHRHRSSMFAKGYYIGHSRNFPAPCLAGSPKFCRYFCHCPTAANARGILRVSEMPLLRQPSNCLLNRGYSLWPVPKALHKTRQQSFLQPFGTQSKSVEW